MVHKFLIIFLLGLFCKGELVAQTTVYFGTYTRGSSDGIYHSELNLDTGELSQPILSAQIENPSFVAIHPSGRFLYAVTESGYFHGKKGGGISAYAINENRTLRLLNQKNTRGGAPCHLCVSPDGRIVMAANYSGGSVISFMVNSDGSLSDGGFNQHQGASWATPRQKAPYAHSVNIDPFGKRAMVADLGLDQIIIYDLDNKTGKFAQNTHQLSLKTKPGGGPRHLSFHPNGRFAYSNLEITREIVAMTYEPEYGKLAAIQTLPTTPQGAKGSTAECLVHPSGKYVYVSNRGHNSIAAFSINQENGKLSFLETESTQGEIPRGFGIDPTGRFLIAGHQKSPNVTVLRIDQQSGELHSTGKSAYLDQVVNVRFLAK